MGETGEGGKVSTLEINQEGTSIRDLDQQRLQKLKQVLKGIEDAKLKRIISLKKMNSQIDLIALELIQFNCLSAIALIEKESGDLYGIYHYQKEITSGFVHMRSSNGIIGIIQHGMQQFMTHLNTTTLESTSVPLNNSNG